MDGAETDVCTWRHDPDPGPSIRVSRGRTRAAIAPHDADHAIEIWSETMYESPMTRVCGRPDAGGDR